MTVQHIIRAVSIDPESLGVVFEYVTPAVDVRAVGSVINHALLIPDEPEFEEILSELRDAHQWALRRALKVHDAAEPAVEEPLAEGPAPFDNPLERNPEERLW